MTTAIITQPLREDNTKHDTAKKWLQRHLRKKISRQVINTQEQIAGVQRRLSLKRPVTAPAMATTTELDKVPPMPPLPANFKHFEQPSSLRPPPTPDPDIGRNVNAWLNQSVRTPSPRLMGGLPYWREAPAPVIEDSSEMQHAVPLDREPMLDRPSTSHCHGTRPIRRRHGMKVQVQMPSLLRNRPQRTPSRNQANRQSASMPLIGVPYQRNQQATPPTFYVPDPTYIRTAHQTSNINIPVLPRHEQSNEQHAHNRSYPSRECSDSPNTNSLGSSFERRVNAVFKYLPTMSVSSRPTTATTSIVRGDSMGTLSDVPTYATGPPPPSYRSRTASIMTTSSFGCVDGLTPEQRQLSQQRAASRKGMREKWKKFARNFST